LPENLKGNNTKEKPDCQILAEHFKKCESTWSDKHFKDGNVPDKIILKQKSGLTGKNL